MTLRSGRAPRLRFAGAATFWDPPAADRAGMRDAARRLGEVLRARVDFRGAFTIDGILSADGWVATECNPRFGAGLHYTRSALPDLPLDLLHHVVIAGDGGAVRAEALEGLVVGAADAKRSGATWTPTAATWTESRWLALRGDEHGYALAGADDTADAMLSVGPGPMGGFVRCEFAAARTSTGPPTAPRAVAALAFASQHCGAEIPALRAPSAVR